MVASKALKKSINKYQKKVYDNILVRFPKGTKDRIKNTGESVNGFINKAVEEKLERDGK